MDNEYDRYIHRTYDWDCREEMYQMKPPGFIPPSDDLKSYITLYDFSQQMVNEMAEKGILPDLHDLPDLPATPPPRLRDVSNPPSLRPKKELRVESESETETNPPETKEINKRKKRKKSADKKSADKNKK